MAIKDFTFLRNTRGLKRQDADSVATYRDVDLPMRQSFGDNNPLAETYSGQAKMGDIASLTDLPAITNALVTIFSTRKGGRPLVPKLGLDLRQYIGQPITEDVKYLIDEDIRREIRDYEPRVTVVDLEVTSENDDNQLNLKLKCAFPNLPGRLKDIFITLKNTGEVFTGIK